MIMKKLLLILLPAVFIACVQCSSKPEATPEVFTARFETTKGNFDIEVTRKYSPKAADRLYSLIIDGYYNNALFYRVVPGFVAQAGQADTIRAEKWKAVVPDEKVVYSNTKGTLSFARQGKDSRGFDFFINLNDNTRLDTVTFEGVKGYPAFGRVTKGIKIVERLYSGYGESTMADGTMYSNRRLFNKTFPELDRIKKAYITLY